MNESQESAREFTKAVEENRQPELPPTPEYKRIMPSHRDEEGKLSIKHLKDKPKEHEHFAESPWYGCGALQSGPEKTSPYRIRTKLPEVRWKALGEPISGERKPNFAYKVIYEQNSGTILSIDLINEEDGTPINLDSDFFVNPESISVTLVDETKEPEPAENTDQFVPSFKGLRPEWRAIAQDSNGKWWAYETSPTPLRGHWDFSERTRFLGRSTVKGDWKETLMLRSDEE